MVCHSYLRRQRSCKMSSVMIRAQKRADELVLTIRAVLVTWPPSRIVPKISRATPLAYISCNTNIKIDIHNKAIRRVQFRIYRVIECCRLENHCPYQPTWHELTEYRRQQAADRALRNHSPASSPDIGTTSLFRTFTDLRSSMQASKQQRGPNWLRAILTKAIIDPH